MERDIGVTDKEDQKRQRCERETEVRERQKSERDRASETEE